MDNAFRRSVAAGEIVFSEGEIGLCAYVIERGAVEISVRREGRSVPLATRRAGEMFGEMAIVDQTPRSATARAVEPCDLLVLSEPQMSRRIAALDPVMRMVLQVILERFRDTIRQISADTPPATGCCTGQAGAPGEDHQAAIERIVLEQALEAALAAREFFLCYQPIVAARSGVVAGYEALMRWRHPRRGVISPGEFIPVAEESGVLRGMTLWAIEEVCGRLADGPAPAGAAPDFRVSINVSATDLCDETFFDELRRIVADRRVDPGRLAIELTETQLMANADVAAEMMARYRAFGFLLSIDDFGTGYSSLSYLAAFPADYLKIDQSFIRSMLRSERDLNLVSAMIDLGQRLGMTVVAEGVETEEERLRLVEVGCDRLQGYLFARPRPWGEIVGG